MPTFDAAWDPIANASELSASRWNDVLGDLQAFLVDIDDSFFTTGGFDPDKVDGTAMTLGDLSGGPTEQVVSRDSRFTGDLRIGGQERLDGVLNAVFTGVSDVVLDATDKRLIFISQADGGTTTVTGMTGGKEGQVVTLMASAASTSGTIIFEHDIVGDTTVDELSLQGRADFSTSVVSADRRLALTLIYTDMGGRFTNKHWVEMSRRTG